MLTVTVSQLNRYMKAVVEEDRKLADLYVKGEISNYTRHYRSGHLYFTLRDRDSAVKAVMFRGAASELRFEPEDGMAVLARGNVGVYERDGVYQLYVTDLQPDGAGALAVAFEQVKARLQRLGMFDAAHKKPIPARPRRIGVVTSEGGAALQDIVNILTRRYPLCTLVLSSAAVQGREAPASLVRALEALDGDGCCDVIILARGGGSAEELSCFNDEGLARAVFRAVTPVVAAVGHETDYTICDLVADLRAPTPSAAAELCTPSALHLAERLEAVRKHLEAGALLLLERSGEALEERKRRRSLGDPRHIASLRQERLDFLSQSLYNKKCIFIREYSQELGRRAGLLDSLSPLRVLERGYCVALSRGGPVTSAAGLEPGGELTVRFRDGSVDTTVRQVRIVEIDDNEKIDDL